jgi:hypothetical protein
MGISLGMVMAIPVHTRECIEVAVDEFRTNHPSQCVWQCAGPNVCYFIKQNYKGNKRYNLGKAMQDHDTANVE